MKRQPNTILIGLTVPLLGITLVSIGLTPVRGEPKQQRPLVLAYYYPWYVKGDWSRHKYVGTPKLGQYGTNDSGVAEQHIRWARAGGVDAFGPTMVAGIGKAKPNTFVAFIQVQL